MSELISRIAVKDTVCPALGRLLTACPVDRLLPALILLGGCLNGLAARMVETIATEGIASPLPGVSPFEALAMVAAAWLLLIGPAAQDQLPARLWIAHGLALAAILYPSSTLAWAATAAYGLCMAWAFSGRARQGALLFAALAVSAIWSIVMARWLALPITTQEAVVTAALHNLLGNPVSQTGNIVGGAGGHALIVLAQCSSLEGLPRALVGLSAVFVLAGGTSTARLGAAAVVASAVYVLGSTTRLVLMAWSADVHAVVHGPIGSNLYDLIQTVAVMGIAIMAARQ